MPDKLAGLLDTFLADPGHTRTVRNLFENPADGFSNRFELEACLAALHRECYLFPTAEPDGRCRGDPCHAVPAELAASILALRRRLKSEIRDTITLQGHLQTRHFDRASQNNSGHTDRANKVYKLYLMESSIGAASIASQNRWASSTAAP